MLHEKVIQTAVHWCPRSAWKVEQTSPLVNANRYSRTGTLELLNSWKEYTFRVISFAMSSVLQFSFVQNDILKTEVWVYVKIKPKFPKEFIFDISDLSDTIFDTGLNKVNSLDSWTSSLYTICGQQYFWFPMSSAFSIALVF